MVKAYLVDAGTGQALHNERYYQNGGEGMVLLTTNIERHYGHFKSATSTTIGTTVIATPVANWSLQLTDLIISSAKSNNATVAIQFSDGVNTISLCSFEITTQLNQSVTLAGRWQGWKDARIELVTSSIASCTVSIGYLKRPPETTYEYATWDAKR